MKIQNVLVQQGLLKVLQGLEALPSSSSVFLFGVLVWFWQICRVLRSWDRIEIMPKISSNLSVYQSQITFCFNTKKDALLMPKYHVKYGVPIFSFVLRLMFLCLVCGPSCSILNFLTITNIWQWHDRK